MRVRVLFFGMVKELAGKSEDELNLQNGASVRDVLQHYEAQFPQLKKLHSSLALAVNQQYASPGTVLNPDDEIAILPPVSGGVPDLEERIR
jgi:molybdopterin converting factor subunit 1